MGISPKNFWFKIINLLPLLILFFISLNGISIINIKFLGLETTTKFRVWVYFFIRVS